MIKGKWMLRIVVGLLALASSALSQQTILIRNGRIIPVVGPVIARGCLLIEKGKIVKIPPLLIYIIINTYFYKEFDITILNLI